MSFTSPLDILLNKNKLQVVSKSREDNYIIFRFNNHLRFTMWLNKATNRVERAIGDHAIVEENDPSGPGVPSHQVPNRVLHLAYSVAFQELKPKKESAQLTFDI
jgi:hypothetical protein